MPDKCPGCGVELHEHMQVKLATRERSYVTVDPYGNPHYTTGHTTSTTEIDHVHPLSDSAVHVVPRP
jgi:hypothetical protein